MSDGNEAEDDDEHSDEDGKKLNSTVPAQQQKRRNRTSFTPEQLQLLERAFQDSQYPDTARREKLAKETNLMESKIQVNQIFVLKLEPFIFSFDFRYGSATEELVGASIWAYRP